jgi:hypothetical protein
MEKRLMGSKKVDKDRRQAIAQRKMLRQKSQEKALRRMGEEQGCRAFLRSMLGRSPGLPMLALLQSPLAVLNDTLLLAPTAILLDSALQVIMDGNDLYGKTVTSLDLLKERFRLDRVGKTGRLFEGGGGGEEGCLGWFITGTAHSLGTFHEEAIFRNKSVKWQVCDDKQKRRGGRDLEVKDSGRYKEKLGSTEFLLCNKPTRRRLLCRPGLH